MFCDYLCYFCEFLQVTVLSNRLVPLYNLSGEQVTIFVL